jgi:hypothetical protein
LRSFVLQNLQANLQLTGELLIILDLLESAGIAAIPYKGPTLSALAYGDLTLRESGDLDLLIDSRDLPRATAALGTLGYEPAINLTPPQAAKFASHCNVLALWQAEKEISVELHWELSPKYLPFSPDFEQLRQRLIPTWPGGQRVMTLSPEDLLLYLCVHGAKHTWERLSWIADIARLIGSQPQMDWEALLNQASHSRCELMVLQGLILARRFSGAVLPAEIERQANRSQESQQLAEQVAQWLLQCPDEAPGPVERSQHFLRLQPGWRNRFRSLLHLALTPSVADWQMLRLPDALSFLYRMLRPLRLLGVLLAKLTRRK